MNLNKAEIMTIIDDIDKTVDGIHKCKSVIETDIIEVTKDLERLNGLLRLSDDSLHNAAVYRGQMYNKYANIAHAEAEARLAEIAAIAADVKAQREKYDVKLNDTFDIDNGRQYRIAVVGSTTEKYNVVALDVSGAQISRWNDPVEVSYILDKSIIGVNLRFSSAELRELNVIPGDAVHNSI